MNYFSFSPANGFRDASAFPNPASGAETRQQLQSIPDQIKDYINQLVDFVSSTTLENLSVSDTPVSNTAQAWDSSSEYLYHIDVTASGVTSTMVIESFVVPTSLLKLIAPYVETGTNKVTLYFKTNTAVSSSIISLTARES